MSLNYPNWHFKSFHFTEQTLNNAVSGGKCVLSAPPMRTLWMSN